MAKIVDLSYLDEYKGIDLKGITIELLNNKPVPIVSTNVLLKGGGEKLKILLFLAKLISENKPKSILEIVNFLETTDNKKLDVLKMINTECEREPLLKKIITTNEFPYELVELEKKMEKDPYRITLPDGSIQNTLFDFIKKVSELTKFVFSDKQPRQIGINITATKKFITDNKITLEQLDWYFDNVYKKFIYNGFTHKSMRGFLIEAEDYYMNQEQTQKIIKSIMFYIKTKGITSNPLSIGMEYQNNKGVVKSILENIGWNIDVFNDIISDYSKKLKAKGLSWTVNTVFNNLYSQYGKYIVTNTENITNENDIKNEKEFDDFISENNIDDKDIIKELLSIYKKSGIEGVKSVLNT